MANMCPVCGYNHLYEPPYGNDNDDWGSDEICPSCGFQFGYTDRGKHISHDQWRQQWINRGMQWRGGGIAEPSNWNPKKQLLNIGVKV